MSASSAFSEISSALQSAAAWQTGDLIQFAELEQAFVRLTSGTAFAGYPDEVQAALAALNRSLWDLLDPAKEGQWLNRRAEAEALLLSLQSDAAVETPVAAPEEPEIPDGEFYPGDYFDHVIEDPKMLGQLCDEVKEHMDIAQFTLVDLEFDSTNPETINKIFRAFHTIKSSAAFLGLKNLEESAHAIEDLMVLVRDGAIPVSKDLINVIFFGVGFLKDLVGVIETAEFQREALIESFRHIDIYPSIAVFQKILKSHGSRKIGQILQDEGFLDSAAIAGILESQSGSNRKFGEIAVEKQYLSEEDLKSVLHKQGAGTRRASFVKVANDRLNGLIDIVGELVVNQSMLKQYLKNPESAREAGERAFAQLESITTNIKNLVLSMGMVPIAEIFSKLRVVIRNTAVETGKSAQVEFVGDDTELDRNVIESIYDPLVHMVRNAVDHGLELPQERKARGKPALGTITVAAEHRGNSIEITVSDDGGGINLGAVAAKAVSRGLLTAEQAAALSEKETYGLLFLPGFSTKETVTEVSGRGVGMDVVKQNVEQIHGKIEVQSELGKGSRFVLRIPLTLAIIDGFVTRVDDTRYVLPFNLIEQIIVPRPEDLTQLENGQTLLLDQGVYTPVISASEVFGHPANTGGKIIVVIGYEQNRYGIAVDAVLGKQEIVIKTLNEALENLKTFSGGTIFGDGTIGFVVDIEQFVLAAQEKAKVESA